MVLNLQRIGGSVQSIHLDLYLLDRLQFTCNWKVLELKF